MKKIIGILIAVAILATCMATTVFAAAGTISVSTKTIEVSEAGERMTVVVKNEQPITSFTMSLTYADELELVSIQAGDVAGSSFNSKGANVVGWAAAEETYPAGSTLFTATFKFKEGVAVVAGKTYAVGLTLGANGAIGGADRTEVPLECVTGGIKIKDNVTPPAHEHNYVLVSHVEATCTSAGYDFYQCSCGDGYHANMVGALGHDMGQAVKMNEKAASCGVKGSYDLVKTCKRAGCGYTESKTIYTDALNHNGKIVDRKAATCTENGYIKYECTNCHATYTKVIKATGHNFMKDGKYCYGFNATHHWLICQTCGFTTAPEAHDHDQQYDGYWWCVCGHRGDAVKKPAAGGDYDDVPQTGDITGYVTFGAVAMISMAAAAAYVCTRKFAKK